MTLFDNLYQIMKNNDYSYIIKFIEENKLNYDEALFRISLHGQLEIINYYPVGYDNCNNYIKILKYLINHGADIHVKNEYVLNYVSMCGDLELVKYLVSHGADIHANNDEALINASSYGHLKLVKYLVSHGADIHANNDMALHFALQCGYLKIIKFLVKHGVNIYEQIRNCCWGSILSYVVLNNYSSVIKYLIVKGFNIYTFNYDLNRVFIHHRSKKGIKYFIKKYYLLKISNKLFLIKI